MTKLYDHLIKNISTDKDFVLFIREIYLNLCLDKSKSQNDALRKRLLKYRPDFLKTNHKKLKQIILRQVINDLAKYFNISQKEVLKDILQYRKDKYQFNKSTYLNVCVFCYLSFFTNVILKILNIKVKAITIETDDINETRLFKNFAGAQHHIDDPAFLNNFTGREIKFFIEFQLGFKYAGKIDMYNTPKADRHILLHPIKFNKFILNKSEPDNLFCRKFYLNIFNLLNDYAVYGFVKTKQDTKPKLKQQIVFC